jgi:hypothetical protein
MRVEYIQAKTMTNPMHQPDKPAQRRKFLWAFAYIAGLLGGGFLLSAWAYFAWMEADKAAVRAGETVDDGSPLGVLVAMVMTAVLGAVGGLVVVALSHLAATLYGRWSHARLHQP